jgi:protocatechuate 3,4-dioxygenase beta subunit
MKSRTLASFFPLLLAVLSLCSPVVAGPIMPGDLNGDERIDHVDLFAYALGYNPDGRHSLPEMDANNDLRIDHLDLQSLLLARTRGEAGFPPVDPNATGILEGILQENVGLLTVFIPVAGADVWLGGPLGYRYHTLTDSQGGFRVEGVPAGTVAVRASHPGYFPNHGLVEVATGEVAFLNLALDPRTENLGGVSGFVKGVGDIPEGDLSPIPGASVRIASVSGDAVVGDYEYLHQPGLPDSHQLVHTDGRGFYEIHDLEVGSYRMYVSSPGYESARRDIVVATPGQELEEDFILEPATDDKGGVVGTVSTWVNPGTPENGTTPVAGALLFLQPDAIDAPTGPTAGHSDAASQLPDVRFSAITNASGEYRIGAVPPGRYILNALARGYAPATEAVEVVADTLVRQDFVLEVLEVETGQLRGKVYENLRAMFPLEDALVTLFPLFPSPEDLTLFTGVAYAPERIQAATTDAEGEFRFGDIPVGVYEVHASKPGYSPRRTTAEVVADATTTLDLELVQRSDPKPGSLQGTVFEVIPNTLGLPVPIAGATVFAIGLENPPPDVFPWETASSGSNLKPIQEESSPSIPGVHRTLSDHRGAYSFPSLPPGAYRLHVVSEGHSPGGGFISVEPDQTAQFDFYLNPVATDPAWLMGQVFILSPEGNVDPIEGAKVRLFQTGASHPSPIPIPYPILGSEKTEPGQNPLPWDLWMPPEHFFETATDGQGYFEIHQIPSGEYRLEIWAEGFQPYTEDLILQPGEQRSLQVELQPAQPGSGAVLEGFVFKSQNSPDATAMDPIPGALVVAVSLLPGEGGPPPDPGIFDPAVPVPGLSLPGVSFARTNSQGRYRLENLKPGPSVVLVVAEGFEAALQPADLLEGQTTRLDFWLEASPAPEPGRFYGRVFHTGAFTQDKVFLPLEGATVRLVPDDMFVIAIFPPPNVGFDRISGEGGIFAFTDLPPGGYSVTVLKEGFHPGFDHIWVNPGGAVERDYFLTPQDASDDARIEGTVVEDTGPLAVWRPIEGATVTLLQGSGEVKRKLTHLNGRYAFQDVRPGTYEVRVEAPGYHPQTRTGWIEEGQSVHENFALMATDTSHTILGRVQEDTGELDVWIPIADARVSAHSPDIQTFAPIETTTDESGDFVLESLPPGHWFVTVEAPGYAPQQQDTPVPVPPNSFLLFEMERLSEP